MNIHNTAYRRCELSCNITYYNEPQWLKWWYQSIQLINDEGVDVRLNIVDDGSQRYPAEKFFEQHKPTAYMRLFKVTKDIGFNSHGARNLLMKQTETEWNLLSDIDRQYPTDTLVDICNDHKNRGEYYALAAVKAGAFTLNEYVIHRDDFWLSGGYDEEFVNIHWGDRLFFETSLNPVVKRINRDEWWCYYTRGARKVSIEPVETTQYPDDHTLILPQNSIWNNEQKREELKQFVAKRNSTSEGRQSKPILNFDWRRVF